MPDTLTPKADVTGGGPVADLNPWAEFGLNPDGTPLVGTPAEPASPEPSPPVLQARLDALEQRFKEIPNGFEGVNKKLELLDRLVKAVAGEGETPDKKYKAVWEDFKQIAPPGVRGVLELAEKDPEFLTRMSQQTTASYIARATDLNAQAHQKMLELGKKAGLTAKDEVELAEMLYPFEQTVTALINHPQNARLRTEYLAGNLDILEPMFQRLYRPFLAQRLRQKQHRLGLSEAPKSPPSSGGTGQVEGQDRPKRDLSTPQGRATFHQMAVGRWLDKLAGAAAEE